MDDPRFVTNDDRVAHRAECIETLSAIFKAKPVAHWVEVISDAGVPCGPINRVSEVVQDPQVLARSMMVDIPHPKVPELRVTGSPLKLSETPPSVRHHPPLLGQHNEEVLRELGYDAGKIDGLRKKGVIGRTEE